MKTFEDTLNASCEAKTDPVQDRLMEENLESAARDVLICDTARALVMNIVELHRQQMENGDCYSALCNMVATGMVHGVRIGQEMEKP